MDRNVFLVSKEIQDLRDGDQPNGVIGLYTNVSSGMGLMGVVLEGEYLCTIEVVRLIQRQLQAFFTDRF